MKEGRLSALQSHVRIHTNFTSSTTNPKYSLPEALSLNISLLCLWALYFNWRGGYSKPCTLILLFFSWISDYEINQQFHLHQELFTYILPTLLPKQEKGTVICIRWRGEGKGSKGKR
jgi:hypothetical protein